MAVALTAIHGAGIIHRDLKPSNVLLAPGSPKVIDFGIARDVSNAASQTRTDQLLGTVGYMAPERFGGKASGPLTPASDIFSWGAVIAYAASGDSPFAADAPAAIAVRIMTEQPNLDAVPRPLRDLVAHSLAKNPADRPTARELLDHLLGAGTMPVAMPQQGAQQTFALQTEVLAAAGIQPTHILPAVVPVAPPVVPRHPSHLKVHRNREDRHAAQCRLVSRRGTSRPNLVGRLRPAAAAPESRSCCFRSPSCCSRRPSRAWRPVTSSCLGHWARRSRVRLPRLS